MEMVGYEVTPTIVSGVKYVDLFLQRHFCDIILAKKLVPHKRPRFDIG